MIEKRKKQDLCNELKDTVAELCQKNIYKLLPEIGANIAYAAKNSKTLAELAAIPGRIIRVKEKSVTVGEPELGASTHMGSSLLAIRRFFPAANCIINLRNNDAVLTACRKAHYKIADMPVPTGYLQLGNDFFVDLEKVLKDCEVLPDIIAIPDRLNLEKLILIVGTSLTELTDKILRINS